MVHVPRMFISILLVFSTLVTKVTAQNPPPQVIVHEFRMELIGLNAEGSLEVLNAWSRVTEKFLSPRLNFISKFELSDVFQKYDGNSLSIASTYNFFYSGKPKEAKLLKKVIASFNGKLGGVKYVERLKKINLFFESLSHVTLADSKKPEYPAQCTRIAWTSMKPNKNWKNHDFHEMVWYHSLDDVHNLWGEGYFDYVLDIRGLKDKSGLEGWENFHIPGSYPIGVDPNLPADKVEMIVDFSLSNVCKDSRIFVHCWSGIQGNKVARILVDLGFTNVHAAGPQGSAGIWQWKQKGWELTYDDTFSSERVPKCITECHS